MKKRITILLLCVLALTTAVFAASAGSGEDPLISLSYLTERFVPGVRASFGVIADTAAEAHQTDAAAQPAVKCVTLAAGQTLELDSGQYFVMSSGAGRLTVTSGAVVNATMGWESSGGDVRPGCRYIVCEDSSASVDISAPSAVTASYGAAVRTGCPFTDVNRGDWFYQDVLSAYERGLINGMTLTTYVPTGTLTAGQAVKLAACMHQRYHRGEVTLQNSAEGVWYRSYADYALENGILTQEFADYDAAISRREFVQVFYRALPEDCYAVLNSITDDAIPDIAASDPAAAEIYAFYRAGILSGYVNTPGYDDRAFGADSSISRAEVAAIMNRMLDESMRVTFEIN